MPRIDTDELEFIGEIRNNIQLSIATQSESLTDQAIDQLNDEISRQSSQIASEIASGIMQEFPSIEKSVSEDQIYEELLNKVEETIRNDLRY